MLSLCRRLPVWSLTNSFLAGRNNEAVANNAYVFNKSVALVVRNPFDCVSHILNQNSTTSSTKGFVMVPKCEGSNNFDQRLNIANS